MKVLYVLVTSFLFISCTAEKEKFPLTLWYNEPATNWNEALPIGNGHSGAMVFGGVACEQLQLNENTLYSGEPSVIFDDIKVEDKALNNVVSLLKNKKYKQATDFVSKNWLGRLHQYYQPFGDLYITNNQKGEATNYKRSLDISNSVTKTTFMQNGVTYQREVFATNPEKVIVMHLQSDKPDAIDVCLNFGSVHPTAKQQIKDNLLLLQGKAPGYVERRTFEQMEAWGDQHKHPELYDEKGNRKFDKRVLYGDDIDNKGMLFEAQLKPVFPRGGKYEVTDKGIRIYDTDEVYFVLSLATSYNGFDKSPSTEGVDQSAKAAKLLANALQYDYPTLKKRHTDDYTQLFDRVSLQLGATDTAKQALSTKERIIQFGDKPDTDLSALLFQYARYLMISGSREGGQPLNLQGMWNREIVPPWNCGYTQNINLEMNYWMTELANLSECHEPMFTLIEELATTGKETARTMYNRRGWVAHHNTSIWRESLPNDNVPSASFWPMVQGWLCSHLWERYLFTGDTQFLEKRAYPLMKGAAEFYADWLIDDGTGYLVTPVGLSPENWFITEQNEQTTLSMGPTMDMALIKETFKRTIEASKLLGIDETLRAELEAKYAKLLPYKIGTRGQLQEWMYDFKEKDPKHRHLSHLYGFYPGDQITPDHTPELYDAVERTLDIKGDAATGWSMGWKINCWARMFDGDHAHKIIANLFYPTGFGPENEKKVGGATYRGGLYSNMLDACPPFQIDGNFGYAAGVGEMLLQSHAGYIQLLPALPAVWSEGEVFGLKARRNFEIAMNWNDTKLTQATIQSKLGKPCVLRVAEAFEVKNNNEVVSTSTLVIVKDKSYYQATFNTIVNGSYQIIPIN